MKMSSEIISGIRYFLCEEGFFRVLFQGNSIYFLNEFYLLERSRRKTNMKFVSQWRWGKNKLLGELRSCQRTLCEAQCYGKNDIPKEPLKAKYLSLLAGFRYTAEVRSSHPTARWHANSFAVSVASFVTFFLLDSSRRSNKEKLEEERK